MRRLTFLTLLSVALTAAVPPGVLPPAAGGPADPGRSRVVYRPPVDAPLVDRFRPPARIGAPGNLGVDYATAPGTPVVSAAAGTVAFAGQVGGRRHVVVLHADGIRTTYAFLATTAVVRGQRLEAGAVVGTTGGNLHFGARAAGDAYVDPLVLLAGGALELRLVPDGPLRPESEPKERSRLERILRAVPRVAIDAGATALDWARQTAVAAIPRLPDPEEVRMLVGTAVSMATLPVRFAGTAAAWERRQQRCSAAAVVPARVGPDRIAVLVAGLASSSKPAAIDDVDTAALGYAAGKVVRFSYRGGPTGERVYGNDDSQVDLAASGRRLRALIEDLEEAHPEAVIDVIAHSQGGLVARAALGRSAPPSVRTLVTLATPHRGADAATFVALGRRHPLGALIGAVASDVRPVGIDVQSTSFGQLAESSDFIRRLDATPPPPGVQVTSVAARSDPVVTSPKAHLAGADNVIITTPGLDQHGGLPGSSAAHREIALALAGRPPSCESLADAMYDTAMGEALMFGQDAATLVVAVPGIAFRGRGRG